MKIREKASFEMGGVLSFMKKKGWFAPLPEWVEDTTGMKPMTACTLTHNYDAIAKSGVTWAQVSTSAGQSSTQLRRC